MLCNNQGRIWSIQDIPALVCEAEFAHIPHQVVYPILYISRIPRTTVSVLHMLNDTSQCFEMLRTPTVMIWAPEYLRFMCRATVVSVESAERGENPWAENTLVIAIRVPSFFGCVHAIPGPIIIA